MKNVKHSAARLKSLVGKVVQVEFLDHIMGVESSVSCMIWGRLKSIDRKNVVVSQWTTLSDDKEVSENNEEVVTLVKSCITRVVELRDVCDD